PRVRFSVTWSWNSGILNLQWAERGGPPIQALTSRGFGTSLIEQSAKSEGGSAEMIAGEEGVTWNISLPLAVSVTAQPESDSGSQLSTADRNTSGRSCNAAPLAGKRILVVEDEPLIGLDLVSTVEKAEAEACGPVGTEKEAMDLIERERFDAVLLDANLHGCG